MQNEDVNTWSDLSGLRAGDDWRPALKRVASNTDCILVLVSKASARSDWVQREVQWAISAYRTTQFVKLIIPILLDSPSLEKFDNLENFQFVKWDNSRSFYRKLAERIIDATSRGYTGFREEVKR